MTVPEQHDPVLRLIDLDEKWSEAISYALVNEARKSLTGELSERLEAFQTDHDWRPLERQEVERLASDLATEAHTRDSELGLLGLQREASAGRITGNDDCNTTPETVRADALLALACERLLSLSHFRCEFQARRQGD